MIISAGTLNSPLILERSGIGSPEILKKVGVECLVDLPGVGENFQDQTGYYSYYRFKHNPRIQEVAHYVMGIPDVVKRADELYAQGKGGIHAYNYADAGGKVRPSDEEIGVMGAEFQKKWEEYYKPSPDKPLLFVPRYINYPFITCKSTFGSYSSETCS